jgi:pimeloyl-ACP methyl ester carboxylesterase
MPKPLFRLAGAALAVTLVPLTLGCAGARRPTGQAAGAPLEQRGFRVETVAGPLGPIAIFHAGRGPLVVFLHGTGRSAQDWSEVAPPLTKSFTVVALDLPGHGASGPAEGPLPVGELAASLGAVVDARAGGERAILVGNSLGGWVALHYALHHPERVARVVGISSSGIYAKLEVPLQPKDRAKAAVLWRAIRGPGAAPSDQELDAMRARIASGPLQRLVAGLRLEDFLDARGGEMIVPVDLVWGEEDGVLPLAYGERLAGLVGGRLHRLPGCAHMPQVDCPLQTLEALRAILAAAPR